MVFKIQKTPRLVERRTLPLKGRVFKIGILKVSDNVLAAEICTGPHNRLLRRQHCSSLCSQSEGHEHVANIASALGHIFVGFLAVFGRHNIRPPHFASKVSYSASPQTSAKCPRGAPCSDAAFAMLFGSKPRRIFLSSEHPILSTPPPTINTSILTVPPSPNLYNPNPMRILVINPGSTSTKIALYEDESPLLLRNIRHSMDELKRFDRIVDQREFRRDLIISELEKLDVRFQFDAIIGRGGLAKPIVGGVYEVNELMCNDMYYAQRQHACNLGCIVAYELAMRIPGCRAFIADPGVVDEMEDVARISGSPLMPRVQRNSYLKTDFHRVFTEFPPPRADSGHRCRSASAPTAPS